MYHKISVSSHDSLTVSTQALENQLAYIKKNGYNTLFFKDLERSETLKKKIIITFDDGYYNNLEFLLPLLQKYDLKATIFIPTAFIENGYDDKMMSYEDLRNLDSRHVEICLHSHSHKNFRELPVAQAEADIRKNMEALNREGVPFTPIFAYPYGKYPKRNPQKSALFSVLERLGIRYAVRIGNRVNLYPALSAYELCRIGIEDRDGMLRFRLKLIFGKLKLF